MNPTCPICGGMLVRRDQDCLTARPEKWECIQAVLGNPMHEPGSASVWDERELDEEYEIAGAIGNYGD